MLKDILSKKEILLFALKKKFPFKEFIKKRLLFLYVLLQKANRLLHMAKEALAWFLARAIALQPPGRNPANRIKAVFHAKIYDCFIFFNELELLEIRLNELDPYVDYFVLVEATKAHNGKPKPLYYRENRERYSRFKDKIIHVVVDDMPEVREDKVRWPLEFFHRDQIKRGLLNCHPQDIILVSDADEIPDPKKLGDVIMLLNTMGKLVYFKQRMFEYYLNGSLRDYWVGTAGCKFSAFNRYFDSSSQKVRFLKRLYNYYDYIDSGGWHFSLLGGVEQILYKLSSYTHKELDKEEYTNKDDLQKKMEGGFNLISNQPTIKYEKIDKTYPDYISANIDKYRYLIKAI